jgi:tetratricopeptide (TPR) repeat protein
MKKNLFSSIFIILAVTTPGVSNAQTSNFLKGLENAVKNIIIDTGSSKQDKGFDANQLEEEAKNKSNNDISKDNPKRSRSLVIDSSSSTEADKTKESKPNLLGQRNPTTGENLNTNQKDNTRSGASFDINQLRNRAFKDASNNNQGIQVSRQILQERVAREQELELAATLKCEIKRNDFEDAQKKQAMSAPALAKEAQLMMKSFNYCASLSSQKEKNECVMKFMPSAERASKQTWSEGMSVISAGLELSECSRNTAYQSYRKGQELLRVGELDAALAEFNKVIEEKPDFEYAYLNRGVIWRQKGEVDNAVVDFQKSIDLNPKLSNAREMLEFSVQSKARLTKRGVNTSNESTGNEIKKQISFYGKRVALVIGNSAYRNATPLTNPANDVRLVTQALREAGFTTVITKQDLNRADLMSALTDFEKLSADADWSLIYFAGHGVEVSGINYMIPVDARVTDYSSISNQTVNMEYFLNSIDSASQVRLLIIDACRDNPFVNSNAGTNSSRSVNVATGLFQTGVGLARLEPQPGTIVAYATKHGQVALDGEDKNSPYASSLVKRIRQNPALEVRRLFDFVREDVFEITNKSQQPFTYGSLSAKQDFYFRK